MSRDIPTFLPPSLEITEESLHGSEPLTAQIFGITEEVPVELFRHSVSPGKSRDHGSPRPVAGSRQP